MYAHIKDWRKAGVFWNTPRLSNMVPTNECKDIPIFWQIGTDVQEVALEKERFRAGDE